MVEVKTSSVDRPLTVQGDVSVDDALYVRGTLLLSEEPPVFEVIGANVDVEYIVDLEGHV